MRATKALALVALAGAALIASIEARGSADTGASGQDPRAAIFIQRGCPECHAIAALDVKAETDVGPDLTFAYADVVNRYGMNLPSFFDGNPPGLMGFVLASHLHLTQADRDSLSRILKAVYQEHLADMDARIPSFPPGRAHRQARPDTTSRNRGR